MTDRPAVNGVPTTRILETVGRYWGFDRFRPLQEEAIRAGLEQRDSLVVLPTGGGKSLCYQVPPVLADRTDVVVSPLISLMKDQVDGLRECGYPAAALHSGLSADERRQAEADIAEGKTRLVFVAPERLLTPWFMATVERLDVRAFAIDEAHCISHWGHDFRPEYRQLRTLKEKFPRASVHAYTATATKRVQADIVEQLGLRDARVLVGTFDRPNLVYRVVPRTDQVEQTAEILRRHDDQAAIVYCLSRADTEYMAESLRAMKFQAEHYHAGMSADARRRTQDAFAEEKLNVVAATVAFGMGIDRSDVRCVVHATMPKSIEHYQQETGRAGRDGLEAECVLLYSAADVKRWDGLIAKSAENAEQPGEVIAAMTELLGHMQRYCNRAQCRHRMLSEYFGQPYPRDDCGTCDVCLDEFEAMADSTVAAQKILSCVARVDQRFGVGHVVDVLLGANTERIRSFGHDGLSTHGLMKDVDRKALMNMVYQLVDQELLERTDGDRPVLRLNAASWEVMRGQREVRLIEPKARRVKRTKLDEATWRDADRGLFEHLRELRRAIADARGVPPYVVFSDATLRELAAVRPGSMEAFGHVRGVGARKLEELGAAFVEAIATYCRGHGLSLDAAAGSRPRRERAEPRRLSAGKRTAFEMFAEGATVEHVMSALGRARSTTMGYLADYVAARRPARIDVWVDDGTYRRVAEAAEQSGTNLMKPVFERLGGEVPYDAIRLVMRHMALRSDAP